MSIDDEDFYSDELCICEGAGEVEVNGEYEECVCQKTRLLEVA